MRSKVKIIAFALITIGLIKSSFGQTILPTVTNSILVPSHAALSGPVGSFRLNAEITDGVNPVDLGNSTNRLFIYDAGDYAFAPFTNANLIGTVVGESSGGKVRWSIPTLQARTYILEGYSIQANTALTFKIASHVLTVTSSVSTASTISASLVPLIASNGYIGTESLPWHEINANNIRAKTVYADSLDVLAGVNAADTGAVKLVNSPPMQSGLTNEYGFFGNGAGLTNLNETDPVWLASEFATNSAAAIIAAAGGGGGSAGATGLVWLAAYDTAVVQTNTFTFSGIPLTGKALKIISSLEISSATAGPRNQGLRINNNTNAHYSWSQIRSIYGAAPSTTAGYNDTSAIVFWSQNQTNGQAQAEVTFIDYAGTNNHKGYLSMSQVWYNNVDSTAFPNLYTVGHHFGYLRGLGAVTSITVFSLNSETYVRGRADLYMVTY